MKVENKFLVINKKYLEKMDDNWNSELNKLIKKLTKKCPQVKRKKYWVCNQREHYAKIVKEIISMGEDSKNC